VAFFREFFSDFLLLYRYQVSNLVRVVSLENAISDALIE